MKQSRTIACYEADAAKNLKPFAFLNFVQELANLDALNLGFGYDQLIEKESIWVLSRIKAVCVRPPVWRERVVIDTWHKGSDGIFFFQGFLNFNGR
jgi:medium-chain acyl-[acyl-carrier-protein] hydrolase